MTEHDGAGFPLSYCLLNSATSISPGKRKKTLTAWANMLRDRYRIYPVFIHFDKDMAEILMARDSLPLAKTQCCFWHTDDAVDTRLKKGTLGTVPYNSVAAHKEFSFISATFKPPSGRVNLKDYEGGKDSHRPPKIVDDRPWALRFTLPPPSQIPMPLPLTIRIPAMVQPDEESEEESEEEDGDVEMPDDGPENKFCPGALHQQVRDMFANHYHAHPLIPGYAHPSAKGIREWAVRQAYDFCVKHALPSLWAYLWGNWYRSGRWELWARSTREDMISILKTTMIVESQCVIL